MTDHIDDKADKLLPVMPKTLAGVCAEKIRLRSEFWALRNKLLKPWERTLLDSAYGRCDIRLFRQGEKLFAEERGWRVCRPFDPKSFGRKRPAVPFGGLRCDLFDHPTFFRDRDGCYVAIASQLYDHDANWAPATSKNLGLELEVIGKDLSWYNPGNTTLIIITQRKVDDVAIAAEDEA